MSGMAAFMAAVGGTSLICYLLMNRVQNRNSRRESAGAYGATSGDSSGGNGWSLLSWLAATVLRRIVPARPATTVGTAAEAAAMVAGVAIDAKFAGKSVPA